MSVMERLRRRTLPPTYRLVLWSAVVGVVGALVAISFNALVEWTTSLLLGRIGHWRPLEAPLTLVERFDSVRERWWLPVATTLGALVSGFLVYRFAPETEGHGTDAAIEAYHQEAASPRARVPLLKAITSALIIGSGGVAGKEGPAAQITSGVGGLIGRVAGLRGLERRSLLLASMAAGLAAIFRAPLGMAIFATEILYSGMAFEGEALIYTVVAAVVSYGVYGTIMGWAPLFAFPAVAWNDLGSLPGFVVLGICAGVLGAVLPFLLYRSQALFRVLPGPPHWKPALGGLLIGLVAVLAPEVLGAGYSWVEAGVAGRLTATSALFILALKAPAMSLTIGSGGSGGVFGPTVSMGGLLGFAVGAVLAAHGFAGDMPVAGFVVVGMAAVFAGAGRTPLSTLIMVAEMTRGYGLIVPTMLATITSYLVQRSLTHGRRFATLYPSQVESRELSPLHRGLFLRRGLEILDQEEIDASEVRLPQLVSLLRFGVPIEVAGKGLALLRVTVEPGSPLDGVTVAAGVGRIDGVTAVAIARGEEMIVPRGGSELLAGDGLLAVATVAGRDALAGLGRAGGASPDSTARTDGSIIRDST